MAVVADALVAKVLDVLASTITEEIRRVAGVEEEVEKLTSSLQSIQAVLIDAERRQWKEEIVQLWLDRLKSVACDIDDVLDKWSYANLRSQSGHRPTGKVWSSSLLFACYCFLKIVSRHHVAVKIRHLNVRLDVIATEKDRYNFQSMGSNIVEHNRTTSVFDVSEVKGRDADKENLVSMLISGNIKQNAIRVISVVGMGGIGKTTLAKLVYNDERVESHFHKRIWVCVSDPFDEIRLAKEVLESLLGAKPNIDGFSNMMKQIQELVGGKECLFVLDDVWNEDHRKWEQLKDCLKGSASKSSILVTTRNEKVGRIMGCLKSDVVQVGLLSNEESWELFCMIAFFGRSSGEKVSLEKIGKEVVGRCKGLPLAIKVIAGVLQLKEGLREWQSVLDSELWSWEEFQKDIAPALWLSYYDLPSPLKQCLSYCVIFPKDYMMEKDELIRHWIAQGYIKTQSRDMVTVGEEYFQNLVMRSFFQDVQVSSVLYNITRTMCKMHDIVHDFAQLLVKKGCCRIEVNDVNEQISFKNDSFVHSIRHLSIRFQNKVKFDDSFYSLKNLRSLIVSWSEEWVIEPLSFGLDLQKLFTEFTLLRSLVLCNCSIENVPSNINRLIHLRELDLSNNEKLKGLPDTIWELYNLQILDLSRTRIRYVRGIGRLINLWCLTNLLTYISLPKEVVRLSGLRRLSEINVDVNNEEALSLKHLKNFNQLAGSLVIRWFKRGNGNVEDAKEAQLVDKKHITQLWLDFGLGEEEEEEIKGRKKQDEELVEALNVPPNLEFLRIKGYMGSRSPTWLHSLTVVKMVQLHCWSNIEHLPPLGKLPCLEDLILQEFYTLVKVGGEFLGIDDKTISTAVPFFPKLKSLTFQNCFDNWEEWNDVDANGDEEMLIMPSLTSLAIIGCPKLKALPNFIIKRTSLKLDIQYCDDLQII